MTTALITGASGFIGGHLVRALLDREQNVRCLVRRSSNTDNLPLDRVELSYGDLREPEALATAVSGVDVVYHLAAMTSALRYRDMEAVNAGGCRAIAEACAAQPSPPVLVVMSSLAAAGPTPRGTLRSESDPPAPVSNYGRSKLAGEEACREFADRVPTTIVRAAIVFGPENREMLPVFQTIERFRFHAIAGLTPPELSFIYIDDLITLLLRCGEDAPRLPSPSDSQASLGKGVYFAAAPEQLDYAELGLLLRRLIGRKHAPLVRVPKCLAYPIASLNEGIMRLRGKPDSFNIDKIREATAPSWACSGAAARQDLGFEPAASLEERFSQTVEWYRAEGWL